MTQRRFTRRELVERARDYLAEHCPGDELDDVIAVAPDAIYAGYHATGWLDLIRLGEGTLRIDRATGEVRPLGSVEELDERSDARLVHIDRL